MATAAEIRAQVSQGNALVDEALHALLTAQDRFNQARLIYMGINTSKLDAAIASVTSANNSNEQTQLIGGRITDQATAYAMSV
jgi:hypothetical protein